jgi:hypothetical protein
MNGNFWMGLIVGVALYWAYTRFAAKKASGQ